MRRNISFLRGMAKTAFGPANQTLALACASFPRALVGIIIEFEGKWLEKTKHLYFGYKNEGK